MSEYIDRNALIEHIKKHPVEQYGITGVLESFPAADVQLKKEGKWLTEVLDGAPGMRPLVFVCSRCWHISNVETRYCCNCGARMDGGDA